MQRGADKLGYAWVPAMRSQKHCCGANNCAFGCPTDAKQSVLVTYVPRLLAAGGRLYSGCKVERILTDGQRAAGVVGRFRHPESGARGPKLTVRAKVVVLACGAVQTPALLLRNGLTNSSDQVGRNFLCHPNSKVVGVFDKPIHAWKGTIQGNQIREFIDEGIMITTSMVPPGLLAMSFPYFGARSWEVMRDYDKMLAAGCLVEDTGTRSRRRSTSSAKRKMRYDINDRDFANLIRGVALTSEILFASGARRVLLPFDFLPRARIARRDPAALRASDPEGRGRVPDRARDGHLPHGRRQALVGGRSARRELGRARAVRRRRERLSRADRRQSADHDHGARHAHRPLAARPRAALLRELNERSFGRMKRKVRYTDFPMMVTTCPCRRGCTGQSVARPVGASVR